MIKSIFLNQKTKPHPNARDHCTYGEATNIGILYNTDEYDEETISELIDTFEGDAKTVAKLGYLEKPADSSDVDQHLFTKKDISSTGTIKKDSIKFFIKQSFDFLISLDTSENINFKYVLASSKAVCKIGFETEAYRDLLLMSLKPSEDKVASVKDVIKYLKMI